MKIYAREQWYRLPVEERAGTVLDWRAHNCIEVMGPTYRGGPEQVHGVLDRRQRVYQSGGELRNFLFWKEGLMSLAFGVWVQIQDQAEWIELIDHELNHCYRIRVAVAADKGHAYEAGIGLRWGVPRELWARSGAPEPERPVPAELNAPTWPVQGVLL